MPSNPPGGWPHKVVRAVLVKQKPKHKVPRINLKEVRAELQRLIQREPTEDDLYSYLMYPAVFLDYAKMDREYSDLGVLPTPAFFYGLQPGEEIHVDIEPGKTLFIRLVNIGDPDKDARRSIQFELNGVPRETSIVDKSIQPKTKARKKADSNNPQEVAAPIPGMMSWLGVSVGSKVAKGDRLLTLEAMKMQTTVYAPADGIVEEVTTAVGESVSAKDLLVKLRPA